MTFGLGRLGASFGKMGAGNSRHGSAGFSLTAPVLTLLTDASDNTPLWGFDLTNPLADDVIRIEWDDAIPYAAQVSFADHVLTAGDISGPSFQFTFGLSAFADGPWSWRAYHMRGASSSAASNEVSETINTNAGAFFAPRYFPNRYFAERYFG